PTTSSDGLLPGIEHPLLARGKTLEEFACPAEGGDPGGGQPPLLRVGGFADDPAVELQRARELAPLLQGPGDGESGLGAPGGLLGAAALLLPLPLPLAASHGLLPAPPDQGLGRALLLPLDAGLPLGGEQDALDGRR